jgi:hypothetical protein
VAARAKGSGRKTLGDVAGLERGIRDLPCFQYSGGSHANGECIFPKHGRRLRIQYEGALYHVINRGNFRRDVFETAGAVKAFEDTLGETCATGECTRM